MRSAGWSILVAHLLVVLFTLGGCTTDWTMRSGAAYEIRLHVGEASSALRSAIVVRDDRGNLLSTNLDPLTRTLVAEVGSGGCERTDRFMGIPYRTRGGDSPVWFDIDVSATGYTPLHLRIPVCDFLDAGGGARLWNGAIRLTSVDGDGPAHRNRGAILY